MVILEVYGPEKPPAGLLMSFFSQLHPCFLPAKIEIYIILYVQVTLDSHFKHFVFKEIEIAIQILRYCSAFLCKSTFI